MPERPKRTTEPASPRPAVGRPSGCLLPLGLLAGGLLAAGALLFRYGADPWLQHAYGRWRPRLEHQVGRIMGHPLDLGPYRGLGPSGLRFGPSRFRPGAEDGSTMSAEEVHVRFHPLASWRLRGLVLDLDFIGAQVDLRRNAQGRLWVLGPVAAGGEPPRLALRFGVPRNARLRLWGVTPRGTPLALDVQGSALLRTHERNLNVQALLNAPGRSGQALVVADGNWQRNLWRAELATRRFPAAPFEPLLPLPGRLEGEAQGRFALRLDQGHPSCAGELSLQQLRWQPAGLDRPLSSERLAWRCQDQSLKLASGPWRFGPWGGRISGSTALDGTLALDLQAQPPAQHALGARPLQGRLRGRWQGGGVAVQRLEGRLGQSRLLASGRLARQFNLQGSWWFHPSDLPQPQRLPAWLASRAFQGGFAADGALSSPRLAASTIQPNLPLVGTAAVSLLWSDGVLRLQQLRSDHLVASATLPLVAVRGRGLAWGELSSQIQLRDYPLARLNPLVGTSLQGRLDVDGSLNGPLQRLRPDLQLRLHKPAAGPLRLQESWSGTLLGSAKAPGGPADGAVLQLKALQPDPAGRLEARLNRQWQPVAIRLQRGGGELALSGQPGLYQWRARALPLRGLALALGADPRLHSLAGSLSGRGDLALRPLAFHGDLSIDQPALLRVVGRSLRASVAYGERRYRIRGQLLAKASGRVDAQLEGRWQGPFRARFEARNIGSAVVQELLIAVDLWRGRPVPPPGRASELGNLAIQSLGESLDQQLQRLLEALRLKQERDLALAQAPRSERLERLQFSLDADLLLSGADPSRTRADLEGRGHVWLDNRDRDRILSQEPIRFRLQGPIRTGQGQFDLNGLPLALLSLLTPVPANLRGNLSVGGRYRLSPGRQSELEIDLALQGAGLGPQDLALERGRLRLVPGGLKLDLALRAAGAVSSVNLAGTVPLDSASQGLELRLASRDDGLVFLSRLAGEAIRWKRGSADLQLLVRGSLQDPIANGFLRLRNGECGFIGQTLQGIQAIVLFDSKQLIVQDLVARVGRKGRIRGQGRLGLVRPLETDTGLAIDLKAVPFAIARVTAQADGRLTLAGSLTAPRLGGDVAIGHGTINVQPATVAKAEPASHRSAQPTSVPELVEAKWDFRQPLVLLGPEGGGSTAASLQEAIPRIPWLSFDGLRLGFGPDLGVVIPNVANFNTGGSIRISGRLDPSLRASGVVKLLGGRLNLFTTSFSLDPDTPNVAIFTPSLGLVPYLDIALRTRIADSLNVIAPSGIAGAEASALNLTQLQAQGGFSSLNQLNLILVTVSVSGPADRLAENLRLRSSPPLPQDRLVALIGGNSLAGLSGGGAGTALATVLGQSLLSPLLSTLSDALGQRVSLALYPTYVTPAIDTSQERRSGRVPPQLVLGAEVGYDITDRINASVLVAPNRSDIPPQVTVNYKASEKLNLEASVDSQGAWQTQLRIFFRF